MRFIKTFVLHLYIDSEADDLLCGDLKALADKKVHYFKCVSELAALLQSFRQAPGSAGIFRGPVRSIFNEKRGQAE